MVNEIPIHDDFKIVWLCSDNYISNELTNFNHHFEKYSSFKTCDNYIKGIKNEHKILLVLTSFFEYLLYFNDLPQIHSIYVLNTSSSENVKYEKGKYSKLINVFTNEYLLIERLCQDVRLTYINDLPISFSSVNGMTNEQSLTSLDENTLMFLWNQLLIYYLVNSHLTDKDMDVLKDNMVKQCRSEYQNAQVQLTQIDDFAKNCTDDNILSWYTKDLFVYGLMNKAFRTQNFDLICKFRYVIILLYKKLQKLWTEQQENLNCTTVYRGQKIKIDELQNLISNIGNLISINTMLSTTRNRNVANMFLSKDEVGVMFEINVGNATNDVCYPFADIAQLSSYPHEEEILFFAGVVFRIDFVEPDDDSIWIIKLTLCNQTVPLTKQLINFIDQQLIYTSYWERFYTKTDDIKLMSKYYKILTGKSYSWKDVLTNNIGMNLYYIFINLGNYQKIIEYYKQLLSDANFIDHSKCIVLNIMIGYNYFDLLEYDNALDHYYTALSLLENNNRLTGELYNHIGDVHKAMNNFESALLYYEQALEILNSYYVKDRHIARIYEKISDIYHKQNKDEVAIIYEDRLNQLCEPFRPTSEPDNEKSLKHYENQLKTYTDLPLHEHANILYSVGLCLMKKGDYSPALDKLLESKQLCESHLPSCNYCIKKLINLYDSMAWIYLHLKDRFNALAMFKRAIDIRKRFLGN